MIKTFQVLYRSCLKQPAFVLRMRNSLKFKTCGVFKKQIRRARGLELSVKTDLFIQYGCKKQRPTICGLPGASFLALLFKCKLIQGWLSHLFSETVSKLLSPKLKSQTLMSIILTGALALPLAVKANDQCLEAIQGLEDPARSSSSAHIDKIHQTMNAVAKQKAEAILGRSLTETQAQALVSSSQVKRFLSKESLYLEEGLQIKILKKAGFSLYEVDQMLLKGAEGFPDPSAPTRVLLQSIIEGRAFQQASPYVVYASHRKFGRIVSYDGPGKITIEIPHFITNERHIRRQQLEIKAISLSPLSGENPPIKVFLDSPLSKKDYITVEITGRDKKMREFVPVADGESIVSAAFHSLREIETTHVPYYNRFFNAFHYPYWDITDVSYPDHISLTIEMMGEDGTRIDLIPVTSDINVIFAALRSNRRILKNLELNLPEPEALEPAPLGYGPEHTKGWAEIQEQIAFAQAIRSLAVPAHPYKTHIEYFANKIPIHVEYIEKGILERDDLSVQQAQTAQQMLEELKQEAALAIRQKRVSYVWWFNFNLLLIKAAAGEEMNSDDFQDGLKNMNTRLKTYLGMEVIEFFPFRMILPAIEGELGIMTLNQALAHNVWPIGLVTKTTKVDGRLMNPEEFALHDIGHATDNVDTFLAIRFAPITDILSAARDSLSGPERAQIEHAILNKIQ